MSVINEKNLDERLEKIYEELNNPELEESKRKALLSEAESLTKMKVSFCQVENDRINNGFQEEKILIDRDRIKVEKAKVRSSKWQPWIYAFLGLTMGAAGWFMDPILQSNRRLIDYQRKLGDLITKKFW